MLNDSCISFIKCNASYHEIAAYYMTKNDQASLYNWIKYPYYNIILLAIYLVPFLRLADTAKSRLPAMLYILSRLPTCYNKQPMSILHLFSERRGTIIMSMVVGFCCCLFVFCCCCCFRKARDNISATRKRCYQEHMKWKSQLSRQYNCWSPFILDLTPGSSGLGITAARRDEENLSYGIWCALH